MGYGAGFGSTGDHYARYVQAQNVGNTALAATLEAQAYAHTQQNIPDRSIWQAIYGQIEAAKAAHTAPPPPPVVPPLHGKVPVPPPPVVTPILPPPPSQLPGGTPPPGSGGPVVVVPGTPGPQPGTITFDDPRGPYVPQPVTGPSTGGASGGAAGGADGTVGPVTAGLTDGLANLVASAKANPAIAIGAVLALFFALKGRGTRRW